MPQKLIQHSLGFSRETRMDSIMRSSKHIMFSTRTKNQHVSNLLEFERKKIGVDENLVLLQTNRSIANERDSLSKILALQKIYQRHSFDKYDPVLHPQKRNRLCHIDARDLMKIWFKGKNVRAEKEETVSQSLTDSRPVSSIFKRMRMASGRSRKMSSVSGEGGVWGNLITETIQEEPKDDDIDSLLEGDDTEVVVHRLDDEHIHVVPTVTSKVDGIQPTVTSKVEGIQPTVTSKMDGIQVNKSNIKDGKTQHETPNTNTEAAATQYKKNHESNATNTDQQDDTGVKTKSDTDHVEENKNDVSKVTEKDSSIKTAAKTVAVERDSSIKTAAATVPVERDSSIKTAVTKVAETETVPVARGPTMNPMECSRSDNSATTNVQTGSFVRKTELRKSGKSNAIPKDSDQDTGTVVQNKCHGNENNVNHKTKKNERNGEHESIELSKNPQSAKRLNSQKCETDVEKSKTTTLKEKHKISREKTNLSSASTRTNPSKSASLRHSIQKVESVTIPPTENIISLKTNRAKQSNNGTTNMGAIPPTTAPGILKKAKAETESWINFNSTPYDPRRSSSASTLRIDKTLIHNAATNNPTNWKNLIHKLRGQKDEVFIDDRVVAAKSTRRLKRREKTFVLSRERTIFPGECKSTYEMRRFIEREVRDLMFSLSPKGRRQSRIELLKERESMRLLPSLVNQSKTTSAILRDFRKYRGNNRTVTAP